MKRLVIGLTGGIGSGKSLALRVFGRAGAETIASDSIAREQARPGGPAYRRILKAFGPGVLGEGGRIDRRRLAVRVFGRPGERRRLERLTHPLILKELRRRIRLAKRPIVVADVPLLFEAGLERGFDLTVLVAASPKARFARAARRDGVRSSEVRARAKAQLPDIQKEARADVVARNDGSRASFETRLKRYYEAFRLIQRGYPHGKHDPA